ncbi:histidine kinase [bacterium]|nr:histidine kinase [bacterium]
MQININKMKSLAIHRFHVFILPLILFEVIQAESYSLRFEHLSVEQGLSQSSVLSIAQDDDGFMWFGTYEGVNRYDGFQFKNYTYHSEDTTSLSQNVVRAIVFDQAGTLWVGTEGGLNRYDRDHEIFIRYYHDPDDPHSLAHNRIRHLYVDQSGVLWISTDDGLSQYIQDKDHFVNYRHDSSDSLSLSNSRVRTVYQDSQGKLWVGTDEGLNLFDPRIHQCIRYVNDPEDPHSLSDNLIIEMTEDRDCNLWICTWGGGVCRFNKTEKKFTRYRFDHNNPFSLSHNIARAILNDREGNLWVGTYGGGLNLYDPKQDRFIRFQNASNTFNTLSSNALYDIYEDNSGMLWVGTDFGGVNKIDRRKTQFINYFTITDPGFHVESNTINTIFQDPNSDENILWIGTWGGGLIRLNRANDKIRIYRHHSNDPKSISSDIVRWITAGHDGNLWIGTEMGLSRMNVKTEVFKNFPFESTNEFDMDYDNVFTVIEDHKRQVWVGSYYGGLHRFDYKTSTFFRYPSIPGDSSTINDYIVWFIYEDSKDVIWIGTETGGLNRYDPKTQMFRSFQNDPDNPESISGNKVISIFEDSDGILWVGTTVGLNRFDRNTETFKKYTLKDGLPSNAIQGILQDNKGILWVSTTQGLSAFSPEAETFHNYSMSDGLPSNEFYVNSCCKGKDGELYFGGINGMTAFHPDDIHTNTFVPPVVITDFKIFNESVPTGYWQDDRCILKSSITHTKIVHLDHDENVLSFEFAALDFTSPEHNNYAYIMEGLESEWNYVGNRHYATYSRLPPGEYMFRVKGSNNNKIWNEAGTSLQIVIRPAFWNAMWFRIFILVFIIGAVIIIHRLRVKSMRNRNLQLEHINKMLNVEVQERKLAEDKVQASLSEKEVLLKEIHHRVKNNMQIICSLLSLQSNRIHDPKLLNIFTECQNRVRAMALIHERLYKTKGLHRINFQIYLNDLSRDLLASYTNGTDNIQLDMDVDQIYLPVNQAVPCGLVINELVSNAIKYAFPGRENTKNRIHIRMKNENEHVIMTVEDNGIGLSDDTQSKDSESLGLKLVDILVQQQLRGKLTWTVSGGTRFKVQFKVKKWEV